MKDLCGTARRIRWIAAAAVLSIYAVPAPAAGQGVRGWVGSSVQMVELRPIVLDTVPLDQTNFDEDGHRYYQGNAVSCVLGDACIGYRPLDEERTVAISQDLSLTAWGLGIQGLSVTTLLRTRQRAGSDLLWPRTDDEFDAILGYAQLVRGDFRVRAGRQEIRSGLGFPAFDGGSVGWTHRLGQLEVYGGRSLARGLRDPASEALRGLEDFVPDQSVILLGASARGRVMGAAVTGRYHRETYRDRSGLESERASLDVSKTFPRVRVSGSLDYDFGFEQVGKADLVVTVPLAGNDWLVEATARRYVPYFSLSTIWGFFEPVSYEEAELRVAWTAMRDLGVWASGGLRSYEDTRTEVIFSRLSDSGRRASAGLRWQPAEQWAVQGSYRLEWGPGATLNSGDAAVRWTPSERVSVAGNLMSFQQIEEFRLGEGRALGWGLSADLGLSDRATLAGGLSIIRQRTKGGTVDSPWNQTRAWSSLRILVGDDPGLRTGRDR